MLIKCHHAYLPVSIAPLCLHPSDYSHLPKVDFQPFINILWDLWSWTPGASMALCTNSDKQQQKEIKLKSKY